MEYPVCRFILHYSTSTLYQYYVIRSKYCIILCYVILYIYYTTLYYQYTIPVLSNIIVCYTPEYYIILHYTTSTKYQYYSIPWYIISLYCFILYSSIILSGILIHHREGMIVTDTKLCDTVNTSSFSVTVADIFLCNSRPAPLPPSPASPHFPEILCQKLLPPRRIVMAGCPPCPPPVVRREPTSARCMCLSAMLRVCSPSWDCFGATARLAGCATS